jgi:hypothetical protein
MKGINMEPSIPYIAYMPFIIGFLPFIVLIIIFILLFRLLLYKKRCEHQQIMTAIEKGIPFSELRPVTQKKKEVDWIKSLTTGIALLIIGLGIIIIMLFTSERIFSFGDTRVGLLLAIIFLAVGIAGILRGILLRKAEKALSSEKLALDANHGQ